MTFKRAKKDWDTARVALRIHSIRQIAAGSTKARTNASSRACRMSAPAACSSTPAGITPKAPC